MDVCVLAISWHCWAVNSRTGADRKMWLELEKEAKSAVSPTCWSDSRTHISVLWTKQPDIRWWLAAIRSQHAPTLIMVNCVCVCVCVSQCLRHVSLLLNHKCHPDFFFSHINMQMAFPEKWVRSSSHFSFFYDKEKKKRKKLLISVDRG